MGITFVFALFHVSSPTNISGLVIPVIIGVSVKRVFWSRLLAHIGIEVFKRTSPAFTDRNTSIPIAGEFSILWVCTSLTHVIPAVICRGSCLAVNSIATAGNFSIQTTTALRMSRFQRSLIDALFCSAETFTKPPWMLNGTIRAFFQNFPAAIRFAGLNVGVFHDAPPSGCPRMGMRGNPLGQAFELQSLAAV